MSSRNYSFLLTLIFVLLCPSVVSAQEGETIPGKHIQLKLFGSGFSLPVQIVQHPIFEQRMIVVERGGLILLMDNGEKLKDEPFADMHELIVTGEEKGVLGFAFHPKFKNNGKVYLSYTKGEEKLSLVVSEFEISPLTSNIDLETEKMLLEVIQPFPDRNGGHLVFGPDGMLYIGFGDGGSFMDPKGHAQGRNTQLGKILRININKGDPFLAPLENPFVHSKKGLPEIWAYGFGNPWRFSFDRATGDLWVGDRGGKAEEEIDLVEGGKNYGWSFYEGALCHRMRFECLDESFTGPVHSYKHAAGSAVTGGFVYRGKNYPALAGTYFFADYVSGRIWGLRYKDGRVEKEQQLLKTNLRIISFAEDHAGELYVVAHRQGKIYQIVAEEPAGKSKKAGPAG